MNEFSSSKIDTAEVGIRSQKKARVECRKTNDGKYRKRYIIG